MVELPLESFHQTRITSTENPLTSPVVMSHQKRSNSEVPGLF